jgi:hypothetical protein
MTRVSYAECSGGFLEDDFTKISGGGFGDPMNNYAWSMASFQGDLYVGTGRNIPYMMGLTFKLAGLIPWETELEGITHPGGAPPPPFGPDPYNPDPDDVIQWAMDMRGEIWRYHCGTWQRVHQASTFMNPINGYMYPEGIGYRIMITFNDAIYAGVGAGFGRTLLIMSTDGENWVPVNTTSIPTPGDTRALAVHNGKLYLGTSGGLRGGIGEIYASSNPSPTTDTWEKIVDFGPDNTAIVSLISFNGYLYAATQNINGFEVWRSDAQAPEDPTDEWTRVVSGGAGDAWNVWGGTTEVFNDFLYVGSLSLPIPPIGVKGFDLIRVDTGDNWELIVGSYKPGSPTVPRGLPLSGWPAGFANPLNFYCWSLEEHCGYLYLGTFDASAFLKYVTPDMVESLLNEETLTGIAEELRQCDIPEEYKQELLKIIDEGDLATLVEKLWQYFGGADLWKSCDGIHWIPVSLNGFDNPRNYGFRTLVSNTDSLYVGTSNPWEGCEVWVARKGTVVSCDENGDVKFQFYQHENVYLKGEGFPRCRDVAIYVIPDGLAPEPGNAVASRVGTTDKYGKLPLILIWEAPLNLGEYDVWVDVNQNGQYDCCDVYAVRCIGVYLFMVVPEVPGSIVAVLAMATSCAVFAVKKKYKGVLLFN